MAGISFVAVNANAQLASESAASTTARTASSQIKAVAAVEVQTASSAAASSSMPAQAIIKNTDAAEKTKPVALASDPQQAPGTEAPPAPAAKVQPVLASDPQQRP